MFQTNEQTGEISTLILCIAYLCMRTRDKTSCWSYLSYLYVFAWTCLHFYNTSRCWFLSNVNTHKQPANSSFLEAFRSIFIFVIVNYMDNQPWRVEVRWAVPVSRNSPCYRLVGSGWQFPPPRSRRSTVCTSDRWGSTVPGRYVSPGSCWPRPPPRRGCFAHLSVWRSPRRSRCRPVCRSVAWLSYRSSRRRDTRRTGPRELPTQWPSHSPPPTPTERGQTHEQQDFSRYRHRSIDIMFKPFCNFAWQLLRRGCPRTTHGDGYSLTYLFTSVERCGTCCQWHPEIWSYGLSRIMHTKLHWLDVPERINYKLGMLMYRCQHNKAPRYLIDLCTSVIRRRLKSTATFCQ